MKVLDSDLLVAILRKNNDAIKKIEELTINQDSIMTTIFNEQEILVGALLTENKKYYDISKSLVDSYIKLVYDQKSMLESTKIYYFLEKNGNHIEVVDEMIAGICISNNATLITRNAAHFSRIPNLKIEKW